MGKACQSGGETSNQVSLAGVNWAEMTLSGVSSATSLNRDSFLLVEQIDKTKCAFGCIDEDKINTSYQGIAY